MSSTLYIQPFELKPSANGSINISSTSDATAQWEFTCRNEDYNSSPIREQLVAGRSILELIPYLDSRFQDLRLDDFRVVNERGKITIIQATFRGPVEIESEFGEDGQPTNIVINYSATVEKAPTIEAPKFREEVEGFAGEEGVTALVALWNGEAFVDRTENVPVIRNKNNLADNYNTGTISDDIEKWMKLIERYKYYDKAQVRYSVTYINEEGLTQPDLDDFNRKVDDPPFDPPTPSWAQGDVGWWHFSSLESTKDNFSNSITYSYVLRDDEYVEEFY